MVLIHNCIAHPLMGEASTLEAAFPTRVTTMLLSWAVKFHDWTADLAYPEY